MNPPGGLLDLIEMKRAGRTNADLARLSGGHLKAPAISNLFAKGLKEFPSVASLRGYALALGVSTGDVIQAAAISLGLNTGGAPAASNDLILSGAGALPEKSRAVLRDMAEHLLWWQAQDGAAAPTAAAPAIEPDWTQADFGQAADEQRELTQDQRWEQQHGGRGEESQLGPDED